MENILIYIHILDSIWK